MLFLNGDDDVCSSTLVMTLTSPLMALVVYLHLQKFSKKSSWKVNGTWLFWLLQRKISGSNGPPEMVVLFFRMESSKWKFVFHFFKPILDTSFRLSQLFFGKWNWFLKGLVNRLSHDCHFDIDCNVSTALCRSSSGNSVDLQSQTTVDSR